MKIRRNQIRKMTYEIKKLCARDIAEIYHSLEKKGFLEKDLENSISYDRKEKICDCLAKINLM